MNYLFECIVHLQNKMRLYLVLVSLAVVSCSRMLLDKTESSDGTSVPEIFVLLDTVREASILLTRSIDELLKETVQL